MDIQILLWLQAVREAFCGTLDAFLNVVIPGVSEGVVQYFPIALVYWCINKEVGQIMGLSLGLGNSFNVFLKNVFKIARPYNREDGAELRPLKRQNSYSFPSGHTMKATAIYGSAGFIAHILKERALRNILCFIIILTMLSRMMVGAHTPQDVLLGLLFSSACIFVVIVILRFCESNISICLVSISIVAISICIGIYFQDLRDTIGSTVGIFLGWMVEKLYINFEVEEFALRKITQYLYGLLLLVIVHYVVGSALTLIMSIDYAKFLQAALDTFTIMAVYPMILKVWPKDKNQMRFKL